MAARTHKVLVQTSKDGSLAIGIHAAKLVPKRVRNKLVWSLLSINEKTAFYIEPVPGVIIRPRLVVRIEGRASQQAQEAYAIHLARNRKLSLCSISKNLKRRVIPKRPSKPSSRKTPTP
jgi:hypothetical protein